VASGRTVLPLAGFGPAVAVPSLVLHGLCGLWRVWGLSFCSASPTCGFAALSSPAPFGTELLFSEVEGASCGAASFTSPLVTWAYDAFRLGQALYTWACLSTQVTAFADLAVLGRVSLR